MDEIRKIRYLVAPVFFFASLLWGRYLAHEEVKLENLQLVAALIAASFFPVGFLINAVSIGASQLVFWYFTRQPNDVWLRKEVQEAVWKKIGPIEGGARRDLDFYASATFDHEVMSLQTHEWVMRLWSACMISKTSAVALLLSPFIGLVVRIKWTWGWLLTVISASALLIFNAYVTWRHCTKMIELQSLRPTKQSEPEASKKVR